MKEIEYKESLSFWLVRFWLFALSLHQKERRFLIFLMFLEKELVYIIEIYLEYACKSLLCGSCILCKSTIKKPVSLNE